jgi:hypothetical protein
MVHQRGGGRRERTGEGKDELVRRAQGEQANGGGGSTDRRIGGSRSNRERERERRERARLWLRARGANELGFGGRCAAAARLYTATGRGAGPLGPPCRWPCRPVGRAVPVPCLVPGRRPRHGIGYGLCRHGHGGGRAVPKGRAMGRAAVSWAGWPYIRLSIYGEAASLFGSCWLGTTLFLKDCGNVYGLLFFEGTTLFEAQRFFFIWLLAGEFEDERRAIISSGLW